MDDPIHAVPGTRRPRAAVEQLRRRAESMAHAHPEDAAARGAVDAARWTLRETDDAPLASGRTSDRLGVEAELEQARQISLGLCPGDAARASGVRAWLEWWLLVSAPPAWLSPIPR